MDDDKRLVYAKFVFEDDMVRGVFVSEDAEKASKWTGEKKDLPSNAGDRPDDGDSQRQNEEHDQKPIDGFEALTQNFLKGIEVYYNLIATLGTFSEVARQVSLRTGL